MVEEKCAPIEDRETTHVDTFQLSGPAGALEPLQLLDLPTDPAELKKLLVQAAEAWRQLCKELDGMKSKNKTLEAQNQQLEQKTKHLEEYVQELEETVPALASQDLTSGVRPHGRVRAVNFAHDEDDDSDTDHHGHDPSGRRQRPRQSTHMKAHLEACLHEQHDKTLDLKQENVQCRSKISALQDTVECLESELADALNRIEHICCQHAEYKDMFKKTRGAFTAVLLKSARQKQEKIGEASVLKDHEISKLKGDLINCKLGYDAKSKQLRKSEMAMQMAEAEFQSTEKSQRAELDALQEDHAILRDKHKQLHDHQKSVGFLANELDRADTVSGLHKSASLASELALVDDEDVQAKLAHAQSSLHAVHRENDILRTQLGELSTQEHDVCSALQEKFDATERKLREYELERAECLTHAAQLRGGTQIALARLREAVGHSRERVQFHADEVHSLNRSVSQCYDRLASPVALRNGNWDAGKPGRSPARNRNRKTTPTGDEQSGGGTTLSELC